MSLNDQTAAELIHGIRQLVDTNHQILTAHRASLPQWYDVPTLQVRWCLGRDSVRALILQHIGYQGCPGKSIRIHLNDVCLIDEILEQQKAQQKIRLKATGNKREPKSAQTAVG